MLFRSYSEIQLADSSQITTYGNSAIIGDDNVSRLLSSLPATTNSMIEVHERGLEVLPTQEQLFNGKSTIRCNNDASDNNVKKENLWTLTQFWRKEQVDYQTMKNSRPKFNIIATVDAISPILAMDPSNPFALIEAYDKENTDITCVIVLHGSRVLSNQPAIFPFDTLVFRDVVYKPWTVPKILFDDKKKKMAAP